MYSTNLMVSGASSAEVWLVASAVVGVAGALTLLWVFEAVVPKMTAKSKNLAKTAEFLDFKNLYIERILKVVYYFATIFVILSAWAYVGTDMAEFAVRLVIWPIAIRAGFELMMIVVRMGKNVEKIAGGAEKKSAEAAAKSGVVEKKVSAKVGAKASAEKKSKNN